MSTKIDLPNQAGAPNPNNLVGESQKYNEIYQNINRTLTGNMSWTSPTSNVTYNTASYVDADILNKGEQGLATLLQRYVIGNSQLTATDYNAKVDNTDNVRNNNYVVATGGNVAYLAAPTPAWTAYVNGCNLNLILPSDCGASPTINVSGLGAKPLLKSPGVAFGAGELKASTPYWFSYYNGSFFGSSAAGLDNFFGDGSDGTIPDLNTITTAPNGGNVAALWDMNAGTTFTTGTLSSASDQVVFSIDFGSPVPFNRILAYSVSISTGTNRNIEIQYSSDGASWNTFVSSIATTTPGNTDFNTGGTYQNARYWRCVLKSGGSNCNCSIQGITLNYIVGDTQTTKVWRILYPVTAQSGVGIKQFTSLNLPAGYEITTDNPCQGLILYSQGDATINGVVDMSQKGGLAPNGNAVPMVITKKATKNRENV